MAAHIIWDGLEPASSSNSGDAPATPAAAAGRRRVKLVNQALPIEMQRYLEQGVDFRNDSNTSSSPRHSSHMLSSKSTPSSKKPLGGAATKAKAKDLVEAARSGNVSLMLALGREAASASSSSRARSASREAGSRHARRDGCGPGKDVGSPGRRSSASEEGEEDHQDALEGMGVEELIEQLMAEEKLWSKGSARHTDGKCKPCHYFHTRAGCRSGPNCDFCHIPHTGRSHFRPGMSKRLQCKQIVNKLAENYGQDVVKLESIMKSLGSRSPYLRAIFEDRMKGIQDGSAPDGAEVSASTSLGADTPTRKHVMSL